MRTLFGFVTALLVSAPSFAADKTVVEIAASNPDFETLVAAVKAADLVETLSGDGPFTILAPTDAAFEKLPDGTLETLLKPENKETLAGILTYHVIPGKVLAADVVKLDGQQVTTACPKGSKLTVDVENGTVSFRGKTVAKVIKTDIVGSNGVIHVIDTVLLPEPK